MDWGHINFRAPNESSTPDGDTHIQIAANAGSSTSGAVNDLVFRVKEANSGNLTERLRIDYDGTISFADKDGNTTINFSSTEAVFNEGSATTDFRVESDSNTHMLFVDAGTNRVGINDSDT